MEYKLENFFPLIEEGRKNRETYGDIAAKLEKEGVHITAAGLSDFCKRHGIQKYPLPQKPPKPQKPKVKKALKIKKPGPQAICLLKDFEDLQRYNTLKKHSSIPAIVRQWFKYKADLIRMEQGMPVSLPFEVPRFTALQLKTMFPKDLRFQTDGSEEFEEVRIAVNFEEEELENLKLVKENFNVAKTIRESLEYAEAVNSLAFVQKRVFPHDRNN